MVLALDIGNSSIKAGLYEGGRLSVARKETRLAGSASDLIDMFRPMLEGAGRPEGAALCSVVPALTGAAVEALSRICGSGPSVVGPGATGGLALEVKDPAGLGPDRIAGAVAASRLCAPPVAVVDFGTATTVNFVTEGPTFSGGAIMPGLSMMALSLAGRTARLPEVTLGEPGAAVGKDTVQCILSGLIFGAAGAVRNIVERAGEAEGLSFRVAATGGLLGYVLPHLWRADLVEPDLTLKGLIMIYEANAVTRA